jgi:alpha-L-fucosidase
VALIAKKTGFKYVVFTTEHCDGFCNYNTSFSSYNSLNTPFQKDIFDMISKSFRAQGIRVGAYYCPSLWNNPNYWQPDPLTALAPGCAPNYNPQSNVDMWEKYMTHMFGQARELAEKYKPDIFWFDCSNFPPALDLRLEEVAPFARKMNPDVMITNRDGGLLQDYITTNDQDEASVSSILGIPEMNAGSKFEVPSVLDAGGQWGYNPYATYKTPRTIIANLIAIVAKGGNYLLNLGLSPDGEWAPSAVTIFEEIGNWMDVNGEALYSTHPVWPYEYGILTSVYPEYIGLPAMYCTMKGDVMYILSPTPDDIFPEIIIFPWIREAMFQGNVTVSNVEVLGLGASVEWELRRGGLVATLPFAKRAATGPLKYAFVWKISLSK